MTNYLNRGNKLWEGSRMFLPEHKQALLWRKENEQKRPKPELDEQELEMLQHVIGSALKHQTAIRLMYYEDGKIHEYNGYVLYFNNVRKELHFSDENNQTYTFKLGNIVKATET